MFKNLWFYTLLILSANTLHAEEIDFVTFFDSTDKIMNAINKLTPEARADFGKLISKSLQLAPDEINWANLKKCMPIIFLLVHYHKQLMLVMQSSPLVHHEYR